MKTNLLNPHIQAAVSNGVPASRERSSEGLGITLKRLPAVGRIWETAGMKSSLRIDWATPWRIFELLDREFSFDLDACATTRTATVPRFFEAGAIDRAWYGKVWCNPPYGRVIGQWVEKGWREAQMGALVVMLLPARTDTQWFHAYCLLGEIRFLRGRLQFDDRPNTRGRCPFPSMIVIFRPAEQQTPASNGLLEDAPPKDPKPDRQIEIKHQGFTGGAQ